jgi:hypothetical protein
MTLRQALAVSLREATLQLTSHMVSRVCAGFQAPQGREAALNAPHAWMCGVGVSGIGPTGEGVPQIRSWVRALLVGGLPVIPDVIPPGRESLTSHSHPGASRLEGRDRAIASFLSTVYMFHWPSIWVARYDEWLKCSCLHCSCAANPIQFPREVRNRSSSW